MGTVIIEGKGQFGGEFGTSHCNQWDCCLAVQEQHARPVLLWGDHVSDVLAVMGVVWIHLC